MPPQQRRSNDEGMSLGEVARLIEALRFDTTTRFDKIDDRLGRFEDTHLQVAVYNSDKRATDIYTAGLEARVLKLEGTLQWVLRTTGGAFIVAIITLLFAASQWV